MAMEDIALHSTIGSDALPKFFDILRKYIQNGHILTAQSKMPFILLTQPLNNLKISGTNQDISSEIFLPFKGLHYLQNPETGHETRLFVKVHTPYSLNCLQIDNKSKQNSSTLHQSDVLFIDIEDYAYSCEKNIVFISAAVPIEAQIDPLVRFNFKYKKYQFYLTNWEQISQSSNSPSILSLLGTIKKIALKYNLRIESEILPLSLNRVEFTKDNLIPLQYLFQCIGDNFIISNKFKKEFIFQIISLHDTLVGSTTLFQSFQAREFQENIKPTRGIDIHVLKHQVNDYNFIFQIFDIAGDPRWHFLAENFLAYAKAAFFMIDLSNPQTINTLQPHLKTLEARYPKLPIILLGTKNDLQNQEKDYVLPDWLIESKQIIGYVKLSSQQPDSLKQAFNIVIKKLMKNFLFPMESVQHSDVGLFNTKLSEYPPISSFLNQIELITYNYNYDVERYFKEYNAERIHQELNASEYISNLLKIDDLLIQAYGLNALKYIILPNDDILKLLNHIQDFPEFHCYLLLELIWFQLKYNKASFNEENNISNKNNSQLSHYFLDYFYEICQQMQLFENNIPFCLLLIDIFMLIEKNPEKLQKFLIELMVDGLDFIQKSSYNAYRLLFDHSHKFQNRDHFLTSINDKHRELLVQNNIKRKIVNKNEFIQINSIQNIAAFQEPKYIKILLPLFILFSDENKIALCNALAKIEPSRFKDHSYRGILNDLNQNEREILIGISQKGLFDIDYEKRLASIKLLADLNEKNVQDTIIIALNDPKESIRLIAVKTLAKQGNTSAIVPLFLCYISSLSPILNEEIITAFVTIDPRRFMDRSIQIIINNLTSPEKEEIINQIISMFPKIQDDAKKQKYIEICHYFPDVQIIKTLFSLLKEPSLRTQQIIRKSITAILSELSINQTCDEKLLNTLMQLFDESILLSRVEIDVENFLKKIPRVFILKALLYEKLQNTRKLNALLAYWYPINIPLFYNLAKKDHYDIFQQFLRHMHSTQIDFNTFHAYLLLSYPFSLDHLVEYIKKVANQISGFQLTQLYRLSDALSSNNQFKIQNSEFNHFIFL